MSPIDPAPLRLGLVCLPRIGGSGILATMLGGELARRGHEVVVFSPAAPSRFDPSVPGLTFREIATGPGGRSFPPTDYTEELADAILAESAVRGFDALHAHYAYPHARGIVRAAERLPGPRPQLITTLHGSDVARLTTEPRHRAALDACDRITTVSDFLRREIETRLHVAGPIDVIPNFFTPTYPRHTRDEVRAELGLGESEFLAVHMSNVRPVKRIDLLLQTLARTGPHIRLLLMAGGDFSPYEPLLREYGVADRVFLRRDVKRVEDWLVGADCGIYTSEQESFGLSILETQVHACPVLAYRVGGIPDVVPDPSRLVPFGDVGAMAAQLEELAADRALARRLGERAERHALSHFTADRVVPDYVRCYRHPTRVVAVSA
ncbi:MAG: glycosyltransferase [Verrucomicrobia bacterium]|nr:glycosyltransferase [Verrucomicrobiota bacterium]